MGSATAARVAAPTLLEHDDEPAHTSTTHAAADRRLDDRLDVPACAGRQHHSPGCEQMIDAITVRAMARKKRAIMRATRMPPSKEASDILRLCRVPKSTTVWPVNSAPDVGGSSVVGASDRPAPDGTP